MAILSQLDSVVTYTTAAIALHNYLRTTESSAEYNITTGVRLPVSFDSPITASWNGKTPTVLE